MQWICFNYPRIFDQRYADTTVLIFIQLGFQPTQKSSNATLQNLASHLLYDMSGLSMLLYQAHNLKD